MVAHIHWLALLSLTGAFVQGIPHLLAAHVHDAHMVIKDIPLLLCNAYSAFVTLQSKMLQKYGFMCYFGLLWHTVHGLERQLMQYVLCRCPRANS